MAKSVRALLDTVMQALPEVGNLGLLFFLLFFIFAALGVELFGRIGSLIPFLILFFISVPYLFTLLDHHLVVMAAVSLELSRLESA